MKYYVLFRYSSHLRNLRAEHLVNLKDESMNDCLQFERKAVVVIRDTLVAIHAQTHFSHPLALPLSGLPASGEGSAQEGVSSWCEPI